MKHLNDLFKFIEFTHKFTEVERVVLVKNKKRWENDSEHSYQLAMLGWYIAESQKLRLKKDLVIKYALVHDLVEVYAGDTYFFSTDKSHKANKKKRERKSALRIKKEFPKFKNLYWLIQNYENLKDKESKFVYALDKVIPVINIYLDNGRTWKKKGVTLQMLIDMKKEPVSVSPEVKKYFYKLINLIKSEGGRLFKKSA